MVRPTVPARSVAPITATESGRNHASSPIFEFWLATWLTLVLFLPWPESCALAIRLSRLASQAEASALYARSHSRSGRSRPTTTSELQLNRQPASPSASLTRARWFVRMRRRKMSPGVDGPPVQAVSN